MTIVLKIGGATTGRKFTDPIRYFKANDPYYWEVDNIPLKQIQENVKYVNDRLNTAIVSGNLDVSRQDIAELKPYVTNSDNKVRVKPGRYTSRINNAHGIDHLDAFVRHSSSDIIGNYTNYAWIDSTPLDALIARIQSTVGSDALNLNGLSERVFAQLARNPDEVVDPGDEDPDSPSLIQPNPSTLAASPGGGNLHGYWQSALPISEYLNWFKYASFFNSGSTGGAVNEVLFQTTTQAGLDPNKLLNLPILENALIKYWRGTARTAIVDVPTELDITIPNFDEDDFPVAGAVSRIDLVFIYSKPVDTSAVTIGKYAAGGGGRARTKITEPILGVLKGAGIGVDTNDFTARSAIEGAESNSLMLASVADQNNTDNGFKVGVNQKVAIHGSFPSPEDLLNIAPLLSEQLEEDSWFLTGQTIFPVAYVKVNKNPGVNVVGNPVIVDDDIVDIRPLFRTAELTYNERAGIAAAMPPLSMANRAVGKYELEHAVNAMHEHHQAQLDILNSSQLTFTTEHTYMLNSISIPPADYTNEYTRSNIPAQSQRGTILFNTFANPSVQLATDIGLNTGTVGGQLYDLAPYVNSNITTPNRIKYVIMMIKAEHKEGRDTRGGPPTIYINADSVPLSSGNRTNCNGRTSRWGDLEIMRYGISITSESAQVYAGSYHTFYLPVEDNDNGELNIFTYCDDTDPDPTLAEYYELSLMGYIYTKVNRINLL